MTEPKIAQKRPYAVDLQEGEVVFWCACGRSANQPRCDGSHAGTDITPVRWEAPSTSAHTLCGCKQTSDEPRCDGTHSEL